MKRITVNLDKETEKIFKRISKSRHYGWISKDFREMLKAKYGTEKKELLEELNEKQNQRNKLEEQIKQLAKRINKIK